VHLNGTKVHSAVLHEGDRLQLGDVIFVFTSARSAGAAGMALFVRFWGTRGRFRPRAATRAATAATRPAWRSARGETLLICDAGSGIRELGMDLMRRGLARIEAHLFFSHAHWDHIQGFPFFTPAYVPTNRLHIYGAAAGGRAMHSLLSGQMTRPTSPWGSRTWARRSCRARWASRSSSAP